MSDAGVSPSRPPWTASSDDVLEFIQLHGHSYSLDQDDYRDPGPFAQRVREGKNDPIYNAHSYHTKVPPRGIVPYLEHYTGPGDLVLDPFCGSGMTGVACLMTGRHAILNDLSPAATHIAYNYCTPVDTSELMREFARIEEAVRAEFDWLYGTTCDHGHPATIQYTVWSDVYQCRSCRGEIVLWKAALDPGTGEMNGDFRCPTCGKGPWRKTELALLRVQPVETVYECKQGCHPSRGRHPTTDAEKSQVADIDARQIPYWYPSVPFGVEREMWRGGHRAYGISRVGDFWTKRNLRALARLWGEIQNSPCAAARSYLRFLFTASCLNTSRLYKYRSDRKGGIVTGTLYVPALTCELNVLSQFTRRLDSATACQSRSKALCTVGSATDLGSVSDSTIDYAFTDPPFGSNIFYSDCSLLWESWLGHHTDERFEAVWNKKRKPDQGGKSLADYERLMGESFQEMFRVLKPGRWASVVFHNSDDRVWQAIQRGAVAAGFDVVNAIQLDKVQLTFKGTKGEKGEENVTNKDLVLNLQKPLDRKSNGFTLADDVEGVIADALVAHLALSPEGDERGLQSLQGLSIRALVNAGYQIEVSWRSVRAALQHLGCKEVDGRWYLPGDFVAGASLDIREEASAIGWLRQSIERRGPQTRGELTPAFQQASVGIQLKKSVPELLEENFVFDDHTNRWSLPTSADRERLNDANALRERREISRLAEGHPARGYSDSEMVELAAAAYRMKLYSAVLRIVPLVRLDALGEAKYGLLAQLQDLARLKMETGHAVGATQGRLL